MKTRVFASHFILIERSRRSFQCSYPLYLCSQAKDTLSRSGCGTDVAAVEPIVVLMAQAFKERCRLLPKLSDKVRVLSIEFNRMKYSQVRVPLNKYIL